MLKQLEIDFNELENEELRQQKEIEYKGYRIQFSENNGFIETFIIRKRYETRHKFNYYQVCYQSNKIKLYRQAINITKQFINRNCLY